MSLVVVKHFEDRYKYIYMHNKPFCNFFMKKKKNIVIIIIHYIIFFLLWLKSIPLLHCTINAVLLVYYVYFLITSVRNYQEQNIQKRKWKQLWLREKKCHFLFSHRRTSSFWGAAFKCPRNFVCPEPHVLSQAEEEVLPWGKKGVSGVKGGAVPAPSHWRPPSLLWSPSWRRSCSCGRGSGRCPTASGSRSWVGETRPEVRSGITD